MRLAVAVLVLLALSARPARGQFLDPDRCFTCRDVPQHFAGGFGLDVAARLVLKKPAHRVGLVAFAGVVQELAQWDVDVHTVRPSCLGKPGCGFGVKDLVVDVAAALIAERAVAWLEKALR